MNDTLYFQERRNRHNQEPVAETVMWNFSQNQERSEITGVIAKMERERLGDKNSDEDLPG